MSLSGIGAKHHPESLSIRFAAFEQAAWQLLNFTTQPDFIAYRFTDRKHFSNFFCRKIWQLQGVTWTLKTQADHDQAVKEGWIPIFEGYRP